MPKQKSGVAKPRWINFKGLPVRCDDEFGPIPSGATFRVDLEDTKMITKHAAYLHENELYCIEKFDYRVEWDGDGSGELTAVDSPVLEITTDSFRFKAYIKHTNVEIYTEHTKIADLLTGLRIPLPAHIVEHQARLDALQTK